MSYSGSQGNGTIMLNARRASPGTYQQCVSIASNLGNMLNHMSAGGFILMIVLGSEPLGWAAGAVGLVGYFYTMYTDPICGG